VTADPPRAIGTPAAPPLGLRLASAAASAHPASTPRTIGWRFPALPPALADAVATEWGLTIVEDAAEIDPRSLPAFAALHAHARSEQVVRALARRTNLVLPAASALVIGDGPVAATIATTLGRGGTRVVRAVGDPVVRLRAELAGIRNVPSGAPWPAADLVIVSGEGHPPLAPTALSGVVIDASSDASGVQDAAGENVRPGVRHVHAQTWAVESPGPYENGNAASAHPTRIADLLIALSILRASTAGAADADTLLAGLVLA
jgi:hypothetical protein